VIHGYRYSRISGAVLLAAVVALAQGCTIFDVFLTEQPLAEVTVVGEINIDRVTADKENCPAGSTLFWGIARNTGDLDVDDVSIEIAALDSGNRVLGRYRAHVFNGEISVGTEEGALEVAGTSLAVDQSGSFEVCAQVGSVAGTTYSTDFTIITETQ
jgi:hypothetical protein